MTSTEAKVVKNDGTETFTLRVDSVELNMSHKLITRSIISATGGLAGKDPVIQKETYTISGRIQDMDGTDYPNNGDYSDDDYGFSEDLRRAFKEWGPDTGNGFDVFHYDTGAYTGGGSNPRIIDGVMSELTITEDRDGDQARAYTFTIEWTHIDVYIG